VCALCNGLVRWTLRRDRRGTFAFAPLDGATARRIFRRHPETGAIDSLVLVLSPEATDEHLLLRSDAVLAVARRLGSVWRVLAATAGVFPRRFRDAIYDAVARRRYRVFGKYDSCPVPPAEFRSRFLD